MGKKKFFFNFYQKNANTIETVKHITYAFEESVCIGQN